MSAFFENGPKYKPLFAENISFIRSASVYLKLARHEVLQNKLSLCAVFSAPPTSPNMAPRGPNFRLYANKRCHTIKW